MLLFAIGSQVVLKNLECIMVPFVFGPSLYLTKINRLMNRHQDCLIETLHIMVMIKPGQPVLDTIRWRKNF